MIKKLEAYYKKHTYQNAALHFLIGLAAGVLVARPLFGTHPLRWGGLLLAPGLIWHLYPILNPKAK